MDSKVFGQFIAKRRKEKNMTQADLAKIIGVTDKAISRWERGIGFPDINTLEPLSSALDLSVLELMRSEKSDMENKDNHFSDGEVAEIMANAVEMRRENLLQDKISIYLGAIIVVAAAVIIKLSGHANIGGSLFVGAIVALVAVGIYFFTRNQADMEARKIYGFFVLVGTGILIWLLHLIGVNSYALVWGVYSLFCIVIGLISR